MIKSHDQDLLITRIIIFSSNFFSQVWTNKSKQPTGPVGLRRDYEKWVYGVCALIKKAFFCRENKIFVLSILYYSGFDAILPKHLPNRSGEALFDEVRERTWYVWFDEVYPPTPAVPEIKCKWMSISNKYREENKCFIKLGTVFDPTHIHFKLFLQ